MGEVSVEVPKATAMPLRHFQMIAIDLDGTLLSPESRVTQRTREAIHSALRAGLLVCFATGRNFTESLEVLDQVQHYASAVFVGGAMVVDTKRRVTLHRMLMESSLAAEVCDELENAGHAALALQDETVAGIDYLITDKVEVNASTAAWLNVTRATYRRVTDLATRRHEHTVRCGIVATPREMGQIKQRLAARFGERVFFQSIEVRAYGVEVLEIFDPSVNKWQGILHVARAHDIDPKRIIAIGDDVNDIHMIRDAGLGVAMGNARPEIKALAQRVIGSNKDDGLAEFIEELVATHAVDPIDEVEAAEKSTEAA